MIYSILQEGLWWNTCGIFIHWWSTCDRKQYGANWQFQKGNEWCFLDDWSWEDDIFSWHGGITKAKWDLHMSTEICQGNPEKVQDGRVQSKYNSNESKWEVLQRRWSCKSWWKALQDHYRVLNVANDN